MHKRNQACIDWQLVHWKLGSANVCGAHAELQEQCLTFSHQVWKLECRRKHVNERVLMLYPPTEQMRRIEIVMLGFDCC